MADFQTNFSSCTIHFFVTCDPMEQDLNQKFNSQIRCWIEIFVKLGPRNCSEIFQSWMVPTLFFLNAVIVCGYSPCQTIPLVPSIAFWTCPKQALPGVLWTSSVSKGGYRSFSVIVKERIFDWIVDWFRCKSILLRDRYPPLAVKIYVALKSLSGWPIQGHREGHAWAPKRASSTNDKAAAAEVAERNLTNKRLTKKVLAALCVATGGTTLSLWPWKKDAIANFIGVAMLNVKRVKRM